MITARVHLGRAKVVDIQNPRNATMTTFASLVSESCHSVLITGREGLEFVVYNYNQVEIVSVHCQE